MYLQPFAALRMLDRDDYTKPEAQTFFPQINAKILAFSLPDLN
jgi:hypothetical protein